MSKLIWFRNDLRVNDHPALYSAFKTQKKLISIYIISSDQWKKRHHLGNNKIRFMLEAAFSLKKRLYELQIPLYFLNIPHFYQIPKKLLKFARNHHCDEIYFNSEFEVNESRRDEKVRELFDNHKIKVNIFHDQTIIHPREILNKQQKPYLVFTPFKKAWLKKIQALEIKKIPIPKSQFSKAPFVNESKMIQLKNKFKTTSKALKHWTASEKAANRKLNKFLTEKIQNYHLNRDHPEKQGTSFLSPYLSVGILSSKQCYLKAIKRNQTSNRQGARFWISELIWREFFRYQIYHFPRIGRIKNMWIAAELGCLNSEHPE